MARKWVTFWTDYPKAAITLMRKLRKEVKYGKEGRDVRDIVEEMIDELAS